jgi:hypothetical protein
MALLVSHLAGASLAGPSFIFNGPSPDGLHRPGRCRPRRSVAGM